MENKVNNPMEVNFLTCACASNLAKALSTIFRYFYMKLQKSRAQDFHIYSNYI